MCLHGAQPLSGAQEQSTSNSKHLHMLQKVTHNPPTVPEKVLVSTGSWEYPSVFILKHSTDNND